MANNDMDRVVPLGQLDDFKVADGEPDVRGWEVLASDGRKIGEVDELLVDTAAMKVRYLDVDVDDGMVAGGADRHVLIPIGYARLDEGSDRVMVDALASADLGGVPSYDQGPLTRDFETSVRESFSARRGTGETTGLAGGAGMLDTAGLGNTPGTGTGLGMTGMASGTTGGVSSAGMRTSAPDADSMHSTGSSAGMMASADDALRGGERMGAGSQGPVGGMDAGASSGGMGALNERAGELGYDRDAVQMRGDASHRAGLAGSDYLHNADEDFYASDAFDDARFYGSRRQGGSGRGLGGMSGSPHEADRGDVGLSAGTGDARQVDQLSGSGLSHSEPTLHGAGQEGVAADRDETTRLAHEAGERLREDRDNRGVGGTGNL
ncbi:PRC-barrel domain-containing protein [Longimicrobium sp.]|uniref:PRC-barrel domain-containing protein n=1 Tax=Longimicrobium sp. TaxID=2029185 RepID=UPI003B3B5267